MVSSPSSPQLLSSSSKKKSADQKSGIASRNISCLTSILAATPSSYGSTNALKRARLQSILSTLLDDPILADVPKKPSLSDVDTLINLELGSAMRISVLKMDNTSFEVVMMNSSTVKDLKLTIEKRMNEMEEARMGHRHISWSHVWANFCLAYHNDKLIDGNHALQDFGIRNNSKRYVLKRIRSAREQNWSKGSKSQRQCHNCYRHGHDARICPQPKKVKKSIRTTIEGMI